MAENTSLSTRIDNLRDNTVLNTLKQLLPETVAGGIATSTFETGSLLCWTGNGRRRRNLYRHGRRDDAAHQTGIGAKSD